ncbi:MULTISPECIES: HP0268 family nuclease [Nitratiruptor]|uniref:HP0268 domain-containing protein n=1 Tax=Nitratiruptor tergarcus DSM 16512 TaxID=1069081 RepID=A0A1W1WQJ2_9BACT|nr:MULTISPECIES: HP0268 family nuclease [Nitratiruptor]BCD62766.1 hypothetical protein NitYY0813_C1647 [Nitratiruptor sp. YY08-13]BCD66702.1 hypothetical protein NitYY0826_C1649 [Nitratiruptor sp. YY08-26]SMC08290.1 hypothetical protein SAMN05660197_0037 [Nitratiruptor tergarcus DSM 16512]
MELKLARETLKAKPKTIDLEKIKTEVEKEGSKIFYFDRENSHKDLMDMVDKLESEGFSVYFREVKYGLDENDYIYEVHIIK